MVKCKALLLPVYPDGVRGHVKLGVGVQIDAVNIRTFVIPAPRKVRVGGKYRRQDKTKDQERDDHDDDFYKSRWILAVRNQTAKTKMIRTNTSRR